MIAGLTPAASDLARAPGTLSDPAGGRRRGLARIAFGSAVLLATSVLGSIAASQAEAGPKGETNYPAGATATRFAGEAFDACAAPDLSTMRAWLASPYRGIGIYISGDLRACAQPNLSASWVRAVSAMGWKLIPIDVGRQAPCTRFSKTISTSAGTAKEQGEQAGAESVAAARRLDILPGSALYSDIENYDARNARCTAGVRAYLDGWTRALHSAGYLAGVYGNLSSTVRDLAQAQQAANERRDPASEPLRPDVLWNAQWDEDKDLTEWAGVPAYTWAAHQRIKQYQGDHRETHAGATLMIDSNTVDAAVATVPYKVGLAPGAELVARAAPSPAGRSRGGNPGTSTDAVCISHPTMSALGRWVQLVNGTWLPATVVTGEDALGLLPTCATPYQVAPGVMSLHTGPAETTSSPGALAGGTLAWVVCEAPGMTEGRAGFWQRLETGQWISGVALERAHRYDDAPATPPCPT